MATFRKTRSARGSFPCSEGECRLPWGLSSPLVGALSSGFVAQEGRQSRDRQRDSDVRPVYVGRFGWVVPMRGRALGARGRCDERAPGTRAVFRRASPQPARKGFLRTAYAIIPMRAIALTLLLLISGSDRPAAPARKQANPGGAGEAKSDDVARNGDKTGKVHMARRLKVKLFQGWADHSALHPGLAAYVRVLSAEPGALQVSRTEYTGSKPLDFSPDKLMHMSRKMGEGDDKWGEVVETRSGECLLGNWGTAVFRSPKIARSQIWHLSNGRDIVLVTHVCQKEPDAQEVKEVAQIVMSMRIVDDP